MANETTKPTPTVSAADVAKTLSASAVLDRPADTAAATATSDAAAATQTADQKKSLETAVAATAAVNVKTPIIKKDLESRTVDFVKKYLEDLATATCGSSDHTTAWAKLVDSTMRSPKKQVLDTVLAFFVKNKDEAFLNELNALQGTMTLERSMNLKVRLFYDIMLSIARGLATRKTISLEMVRTVFNSDDFVNWVAVKLPRN